MKTLIEYFKNNPTNDLEYWNTDLNCYHISGFAILPDILKLNPQKILDLGCGYNEFKRYIPHLIGIDFANENADVVDDFMNYECEDNSIDVMLALGSINFGNHELVDKQMKWMTQKLKPGGKMFIRVNPAEAPDCVSAGRFQNPCTFIAASAGNDPSKRMTCAETASGQRPCSRHAGRDHA
jgi:SAM-dependent methyltransferase